MSRSLNGPLRVGVGGPVGSGKTALVDALCKKLRDRYQIAVVTNDIYTKEDAQFLVRSGALAAVRFDVPAGAALAGHAFAWAEAITAAAVRLVPLGQSAGQRILAAAGAAIPAVVARALVLPDEELGAAAPGQAIASATHEGLYSRLFRS